MAAEGTSQAVIVLADIGGYTRFMKLQEANLAHAEAAINQLLEAVVNVADHPLILNKLEGDAAMFYVAATPETLPAVAKSVMLQVNGIFGAFERRKREMHEDVVCTCNACTNIVHLTIKCVVHCGEVTMRKFRKFEELSGMCVITAHRLMKNSVPVKEYILVTETFDRAAGGMPGQTGTPLVEHCEGVGEVKVVYYTPDRTLQTQPVAVNRWRQIRMMAGTVVFLAARKLGLRKERSFHGLEGIGLHS
jgi:class 3 adenylate cyclase